MIEVEIEFFNFNAGFAVPTGEYARSLGYVLDEHGDKSILDATDELFYIFIDKLKEKFNNSITVIQDRDAEVDRMLEDGYKTFDPEGLRLTVSHDPRRPFKFATSDIGNLAVLYVYAPNVFNMVKEFMLEQVKGEFEEIMNSGREAPRRNGNSIFEEYVRLVNEVVVPKFPIDRG